MAMLQLLACDEWDEHDIADYMRTSTDVLAACRGLVILVEQRNRDERRRETSSTSSNEGRRFQFCRELSSHYSLGLLMTLFRRRFTARDYIKTCFSKEEMVKANLDLAGALLRFTLKVLDTMVEKGASIASISGLGDGDCPSPGYFCSHYALTFYHHLWFKYALGIESNIPLSLVASCYFHPAFHDLASNILHAGDLARGPTYLAISLATFGLTILLHQLGSSL